MPACRVQQQQQPILLLSVSLYTATWMTAAIVHEKVYKIGRTGAMHRRWKKKSVNWFLFLFRVLHLPILLNCWFDLY